MGPKPDATIVISTRNRRREALAAVESAFRQSIDCQVIVLDDGGSDGTSPAVANAFPEAEVHRSERMMGLLHQRNRGLELARAEIVVFLDDDAELLSSSTIEQTLGDFDHPRIAAVGIPFSVPAKGEHHIQGAPADEGCYLMPYYHGAAAAVRRAPVLHVGAFRTWFLTYFDDHDLSMRLLKEGWVVRAGRADPAAHYYSSRRDTAFVAENLTRNQFLLAYLNAPDQQLHRELGRAALISVGRAARHRRPLAVAKGTVSAIRDGRRHRSERGPMDPGVFRLFKAMVTEELRDRYPFRLDGVESILPSLPAIDD